jgi:hypothetical protein
LHNKDTQNAFLRACHKHPTGVAGEVNQVSLDDYVNNSMWHVLVDTVHTLPMFAHHKAYVRDVVQVAQSQINAEDLALKLNISLGESLVILHELQVSKDEGGIQSTR